MKNLPFFTQTAICVIQSVSVSRTVDSNFLNLFSDYEARFPLLRNGSPAVSDFDDE